MRSACWLAVATLATGCAAVGEGAPRAANPNSNILQNHAQPSTARESQPSTPPVAGATISPTAAVETASTPAPASTVDKLAPMQAERPPKAKTGEAALKDAAPIEQQPQVGGGEPAAPARSATQRERVYAPVGLVRILDRPDRDAPVIGAFRNGQAVAIRPGERPVTTKRLYQCTEAWYAVQPRGWVCVGGPGHATFDQNDPNVLAAEEALPDLTQSYPFHVGVSVGAPRYVRLPTPDEQRQNEPGLEQYQASLPAPDPDKGGAISAQPAGHGPSEALLRYLQQPSLPLTYEEPAYEGMKLSWTKEFEANGRTWLLTPDMYLVPKDKVRQRPTPQMHGVDLLANPEMKLPLAFTWLEDAVKYRRDDKGTLVATDEKWPRHTFIPATGGMAKGEHGRWYWEARDGSFINYGDVTIIKPSGRLAGVGPNDKWVHVRVTWGYLVAYQGDTPVYATAISPGIDGISPRAHATMKGKQFVAWKLLSGDMSGKDKGKDWLVDDVPWVQYYKANYALHGAWWHDEFGRPKSHGCINLPPTDAKWLFQWMDPAMPEGWYAVSPYSPVAKSTLIFIQY